LTWPAKSLIAPKPSKLLTEAILYPHGHGYPDTQPENRLILGDNLPVMATLLPEYEGRINLIYADPPYPLSVRRTDRVRYHRELSDEDHVELLELLSQTAARVMLSGYRCALYDAWLTTWRRIDYQAMTRGGTVPESLWLNFDPPATLHGYDRVGSDYRERERIKRKRQRWLANFSRLPDHEREAIFSDLSNYQAGRQS